MFIVYRPLRPGRFTKQCIHCGNHFLPNAAHERICAECSIERKRDYAAKKRRHQRARRGANNQCPQCGITIRQFYQHSSYCIDCGLYFAERHKKQYKPKASLPQSQGPPAPSRQKGCAKMNRKEALQLVKTAALDSENAVRCNMEFRADDLQELREACEIVITTSHAPVYAKRFAYTYLGGDYDIGYLPE